MLKTNAGPVDPDLLESIRNRHEAVRTRPVPNSVGAYRTAQPNILEVPCEAAAAASASMLVDVAGFVDGELGRLDEAGIDECVRLLPKVVEKALATRTPDQPHLPAQWLFLAAVVEDVRGGRYERLPEPAFRGAVVALRYGLKTVDFIPDSIEGIGYVDDSRVVLEVLRRHEPGFARYAHAMNIDWSRITSQA